MKKYTILYIIISIIIFVIFPVNMTLTVVPYGMFTNFSYLTYILLWLIPGLYIIKSNKLKSKKIGIVVLLGINIAFIYVYIYFADKYAEENEKILNEDIQRNLQMIDKNIP